MEILRSWNAPLSEAFIEYLLYAQIILNWDMINGFRLFLPLYQSYFQIGFSWGWLMNGYPIARRTVRDCPTRDHRTLFLTGVQASTCERTSLVAFAGCKNGHQPAWTTEYATNDCNETECGKILWSPVIQHLAIKLQLRIATLSKVDKNVLHPEANPDDFFQLLVVRLKSYPYIDWVVRATRTIKHYVWGFGHDSGSERGIYVDMYIVRVDLR